MTEQSFFLSILSTVCKIFDYRGTANRCEYNYYKLFLLSCFFIFWSILTLPYNNNNMINLTYEDTINLTYENITIIEIICLVYIILTLSDFSLTIRRSRDALGKRGVYLAILFLFIPILNFVFSLFLMFKKGNNNLHLTAS